MNRYVESNRELWDKWTKVHIESDFYRVEEFKSGELSLGKGIRLVPYEVEEVGDVAGKDLLHLQCHFGIDTLSWARLGAGVTGIDISEESIDAARNLADELGIPANFIRSDIYDLPSNLEGNFDIVYTSWGVLGWLPDITRWAEIAARYVRPGGFLYLTEAHPVLWAFDDEANEPKLKHHYWSTEDPIALPVEGSYADAEATVDHDEEYGWNHGLGEVVTALIDAGLQLEFLRERPFLVWGASFLEETDKGYWQLPGDLHGTVPLSYSLRASRPGSA